MKIIEVSPENAVQETLFCVKDTKSKAFKNKLQWLTQCYSQGLKIKILKDELDNALGFVEYVPAKAAWRPVDADDFMFIHCMYIYSKSDREKGLGGMLIEDCIKEAKASKLAGVCTMSSNGPWLANKKIFKKYGFEVADKLGRFELMALKWDETKTAPKLIDWESKQANYQGWHLLYSDQCPWHEKSVVFTEEVAKEYGFDIKIKKIETAKEAKNSPSGFGVFALLHNGKLIEDHYISKTRFKNIVEKELSLK